MKLAIASDHAGFKMKEAVKPFLTSLNFELIDMGTDSESAVDYPDFGKKVAAAISSGKADVGVLICGSGIGMCITANRFKKVRAVPIADEFDAEMSRKHNNANIACFGARKLTTEKVLKLLDIFLRTPFEGGRHEKRLEKIDE